MNKILPLSASAVVLAALVTPKFIGSQVEDKLNQVISSINQFQGYQVKVESLDDGWFSTQAKLVLSLDAALANVDGVEPGEWDIPLTFEATHGPFLFADDGGLGLVSWKIQVPGDNLRNVLSWSETSPFYQMKATLGLTSQLSYQDQITAFTSQESIETQSNFSGYQGQGRYKGEVFHYQGEALQFDASSVAGELVVDKLVVDTQIESSLEALFESMVYDAKGKLNLASIKLNDSATGQSLNLTDLYISSETEVNEVTGALDIGATYGVKSIESDEFSGEDFALGLEINNLSQAFIQAYQGFAPSLANATGDQSATLAMDFLDNHLLSLVSAEPEINITSLRGTIPEGSFESHFNASLVGVSALPKQIDDTAFWLSHTLLDGQIKGDKAVIELAAKMFMVSQLKTNPQTQGMSAQQLEQIASSQVPMLLQTIAYQGLIVSDEEGYTSSLSLKDSVLKVNDQAVPLPF